MKFLKKDMGYRGEIKLLALLAGLLMGAIFLIYNYPVEVGFCESYQTLANGRQSPQNCLLHMSTTVDNISGIIFIFSLAIFLSLIPLFFLKEATYRTWKKFSLWFIPIALFLIYLMPESAGGGFGPSYGLDREMFTIFISGLYIFISFLVMIGVFDRSNVKKQ